MASDAATRIKYDVFVSFRGKDTRNNFTSHLKAALDRNGIHAFTDTGLKAGEEISPTLSDKISESQVSVLVFSPNYADSRWCLDELVTIMGCMADHGQTTLPVFLQGVEPTHVRKQTGAFGEGFGRLIQDARYAGKVESWSCALRQAADLSGWDSHQISEGRIIEELLNRVQSILGKMSSYENFIGIERVEEIESVLFLPEVRCLGIWGMGGSGKTTLAEKIYDRTSNNFDGACFLGNVREFAEKQELNRLRSELLSQLLGNQVANQGPPIISRGDFQRKLRRTMVLVILDNVSDASQLQELIGDWSLCCSGSKMIAVSRDLQVLKNVCDKVYEVQALSNLESLQLLQLHIFKQRQPTPDQMVLLKEAIKYTQGLPLALVVLGRHLFDKDIRIWKSELAKLGGTPNLQIMKILRTSFDGLDNNEKSIFLDIACLMEGWEKDRVESILDACEFYAVTGIDRLVDKALITIPRVKIRMHDLLQQMGQHIATREGTPSRLWRNKEIVDLLTTKQETEGTRKIEVISMDLSKAASIKLKSRVFTKMARLRILRFHNAPTKNNTISLPKGLKYLPDGLRYFEWNLYPLQSLPPRFNPENLVELSMINSHVRQLWSGEVEPCLSGLKLFDLSGSKKLTTIPNFRNALKLEMLWIQGCEKLKDTPESIQHLVELKMIGMNDNRSLTKFPEFSQLTKLETLTLEGCSKLEILPQLPPNLTWLNLSFTKIKELPPSIQGLSRLDSLWLDGCEELDMSGCSKLSTLPSLQMPIIEGSPSKNISSSVDGLGSLTMLNCSGYKGDALPSLKSLVSLMTLRLQGSNVKSLPEDLKYLTKLSKIELSNSKRLVCIPELPPNLEYLDASNCKSLQKYTPWSSYKLKASKSISINFINCFNLEKDSRNEIWSDFWLRVQSDMIPLLDKMHYEFSQYPQDTSRLRVCIPGNEVEDWLETEYSNIRSPLQVNTNFQIRPRPSPFFFFAVVSFLPNFDGCKKYLKVECECLCKSGEKINSVCCFRFDEPILFQMEHTMLWCDIFRAFEFYSDEVTFRFSAVLEGYDRDSDDWVVVDGAEIVKCGVTPIRGSKSTLLAEEERGGACGLALNLPAPIQDVNLDLGLAPSAPEERANPVTVTRPQKRKRGNNEEGKQSRPKRSKRRNPFMVAPHFPMRRVSILRWGNKVRAQHRRGRRNQ